MIRLFLFLVAVPLFFSGLMIASGQWQASRSGWQVTPLSWPNSSPHLMQTTAPPWPDLSISKSDSSDPAAVGIPLTYTITVTNNGGVDATGVTLFDILPARVNFSSAASSQGNCDGTTIIICDFNTLTIDAVVTVTVVVTPLDATSISNAAGVTSDEADLDLTDNTVVEETQLNPSSAGPISPIYLPVIFK